MLFRARAAGDAWCAGSRAVCIDVRICHGRKVINGCCGHCRDTVPQDRPTLPQLPAVVLPGLGQLLRQMFSTAVIASRPDCVAPEE